MDKRKIYLIIQSMLCIALAVLLAVAVIGIYREGVSAKEENPLLWVFSKERIAEHFRTVLPLLVLCVGFSAVGLFAGWTDENSRKRVNSAAYEKAKPAGREKALQLVLMLAAVCLLIAGVLNGGARDVFAKAVKICSECIGLG